MASNPVKAAVSPISRDDGSQTKFHALACYPELREKVVQGVPIPEVARWLQEEKKQYVDVTRESLTRMLYRFKQRIPPGERQKITPRAAQELLDKQRERIAFKVEPVAELEKLYLKQMERIEIDTAHEKDIGKLFGSTSNEMRLAMDMLVRLRALQQEALGESGGSSKETPNTEQFGITLALHASRPGVQQVINNAESRRKVLGLTKTMMAFLGGGGADRASLVQSLLQGSGEAVANTSGGPVPVGAIIDVDADVDADVDGDGVPFPPEGSVSE